MSSLPISPRKPPLSPRLISSLPASPRTPQSINNNNCSAVNNHLHRLLVQQLHPSVNNFLLSPTNTLGSSSASLLLEPSPSSSNCSTSSIIDNDQLVANSKSRVADVEVKFSGPNVILSTVSPRIPGQALKIISALEHLSLEILSVTLNTTDQNTMIYSFTIKVTTMHLVCVWLIICRDYSRLDWTLKIEKKNSVMNSVFELLAVHAQWLIYCCWVLVVCVDRLELNANWVRRNWLNKFSKHSTEA